MVRIVPRGFTLVELLAALAILAIITAISIPSFRGGNAEKKLEVAVADIAQALRFVQGDARRSGQPRALQASSDGQISLYTLNTSGVAPTLDTLLLHPLSKNSYQFNTLTARQTLGVELASAADPFTFVNAAGTPLTTRTVYFDPRGTPHYIDVGGVYYRLTSGSIALRNDGYERSVQIAPFNGRVSVQ